MNTEDTVIKRNGKTEFLSFDKILKRIKGSSKEGVPLKAVNFSQLTKKIIDRLYDGISTTQIDELTAQQCASLFTTHTDYNKLASRILISNHHKNTSDNFYKVINILYQFKDIHNVHCPIVSKAFWEVVKKNKKEFNEMINYDRDYLLDYFGFKTLERAYLMKAHGIIVERPQHLWLRVAIAIHGNDLDKVKETYDLMSQKIFTHATPTLFNAGTPKSQLSSCYLIAMEKDSIEGIYNTLRDCAKISKWAGGIGLHLHNIRATGSHIRGTNGTSNGIVPMLRVFNNTARYVDQCISPSTYIYTTEGPKQIQFCDSQDTTIFNNKSHERIENILEHPYDGDLLEIYTQHSIEPLKITPEHLVLCLKNQRIYLSCDVKQKLSERCIKHEWCDAGKLTYDDLLVFKIPEYEKDNTAISEDDCWMYGLIFSSGAIDNSSLFCCVWVDLNDSANLAFVKKYLDTNLIEYSLDITHGVYRIKWSKTILLPFRYNHFFNEHKDMRLHPSWLNLPKNKIAYILLGLLKHGCDNYNGPLLFNTSSRHQLECVRYLLLRLGIPTQGTQKRGIEYDITEYTLNIPKTEYLSTFFKIKPDSKLSFFIHDTFIYTKINNIVQSHYKGTLYDLQMPKIHNYMIHNGIIHNGGGKRHGSFAMYIEPWHADIEDFLEMKKNHGDEDARARDLFYALWIPSLFMTRVKNNGNWTLMCPDKCPGLADVYGTKFNELYLQYELDGKGNRTVKARDIWFKILDSQIETGTPYMLFKDPCNEKSNQQNLGTIKSSNLCTEIIEYSDDKETAVCNLASIALSKFISKPKNPFNDILLYSKNKCNFCKMAKYLLTKNNIPFTEHLLENNQDIQSMFDALSDKHKIDIKTLPQIFDGDFHIGGFDKLNDILKPSFDYNQLHTVVKIVTKNLNKVIDINFYPTNKTSRSNFLHRPIGIGVQGLADAFAELGLPFTSPKAKEINKNIFETIYHAAIESSMEIARDRKNLLQTVVDMFQNKLWTFKNSKLDCHEYIFKKDISNVHINLVNSLSPVFAEFTKLKMEHIGAYSSYEGSPISQGKLQFDLWDAQPSNRYDWAELKIHIKNHGIRNSLLVAPMPTASTSQILGNNECFEPFTSNIYVRRTIAGEFIMVNKFLMEELIGIGLWNELLKNQIIANNGSIQNISSIPDLLKEKYKIVWEIPMKEILNMAKDRAIYICQSQSTNLWMKDPNYKKLTAMHMHAWKLGLKTGIYYLRTKAKAAPQQFTITPDMKDNLQNEEEEEEECLMCGS
jgi:ribonucleotide reductase alpha subunit